MNIPHLNFMGYAILLDNSRLQVSKCSKIRSPNEIIFVYTLSYTCQWDMAMLFAPKLNLCNSFGFFC